MLGRSLRETCSKGRDVQTMGGARAHRGVLVSGACARVQTFGGGHVAGEGIARGAQRSCRSEVKAAATASHGSGVYSGRSGWCCMGWHGVQKSTGWGLSEGAHAKG